jgi:hypothetical protein
VTSRADGLPEGPRDPLRETPSRRPGSVRRTTSIEQRRGDPGEPQHLLALGRDLRTAADGSAEVLDETRFQAAVDPAGTILALEAQPPVPELEALVGRSIRKGIRGRVDAAVPEHATRASVLHQLLDDLPMAMLISGYGSSREQPDFRLPAAAAERMTDLCAGWAAGATMLQAMGSSGVFPIPVGPLAPDLARADDPLAWHELPPMAPRSVRRRRRIDLWPGDDGLLHADVHFRDSHLGLDGPEDVLHEYTLAATLDPDTLEVRSSAAEARVLPWPECPGALASAGRVAGQRVGALRMSVAVRFTGTSTCTHLNDTLRSLAGVTALAPALP